MNRTDLHTRIEWVDISKGIGILLVVLGHIWIIGKGIVYINSFHMPLFFFLSGYLFNLEKVDGFKHLAISRVKSILVPYFSFSFITYLYWVLIERRFFERKITPLSALMNIFISQGTDAYIPHNPALWFLTCLFITQLAFYLIIKNLKNYRLVLFISSIIGFILSIYGSKNMPWSIDVVFTSIVFFGVGYLFKNTDYNIPIKRNYIYFFLLCICLGFGFVISQINVSVGMASNRYGNYIYFYTAAFLGIISCILIAKRARRSNILSYLGRNSLIIFGLHFPIKRVVVFLTSIVFQIPLEKIKSSLFLSGLDTVVTILILIPIIYLINNYFYIIIGKSKKPYHINN